MIRATINGSVFQFENEISILNACRSVGIEVPTLCNDERLRPIGSCRMCLVAIASQPNPVTSCTTALADGMIISTNTRALEIERTMLLRMLAQDHPAQAFHRFPHKDFYKLASRFGLGEEDFNGIPNPDLFDNSHPYIRVDMSQCILCYRCVRICKEVQGQYVWQVLNKGHDTRIMPNSGTTLMESSCVSCGACVDTCPTAALEDKSVLERGVPTEWTRTICPYCGTGCEISVGTTRDRLITIRPVLDSAVSKGHLCVKGRYAFDFVSAGDRLTTPMIRRNGQWQPVSWEAAISFTATELQRIALEYGPDSIGILGSARGTNEENYLAQKFARLVVGTNNVDCCARVCHAPTAAAMKFMLGTGAATSSYNDIEKARTILLCGSNTTENHPIIGARIKQATLTGANLVVIDPRNIELAQYARIHLQCRPGTNVPLLNAIANVIVHEELFDRDFINERVTDWTEFCQFVKDFSPEQVADLCGVKTDLIYQAARLYAKEKPALCLHGLGMTEHVQGTKGVMCLTNLALLTGNVGKPGTGINPLRGQNNVQGAAHMGCDPDLLTGSLPLPSGRELFEHVWRAPLPSTAGLNLLEMLDAANAGRVKALWSIGYDISLTSPDASKTEKALRSLDLVVVQDMFLNEIARQFGHVFLPAASLFERDGTVMNSERRVQYLRKVIEPVGLSKPDWKIICAVAEAMGRGESFGYRSAEEIWNEIRSVWSSGRGITYERLENGGIQWPCAQENHPGTELLHREVFSNGKKAALRRIAYQPTEEVVSDGFPFILITGRNLYQFNAGTMTMRTANTQFRPDDVLEMCCEDAARLKLEDGSQVRIRSRYGETVIRIRIAATVRQGELFATFHTTNVFLNRVTSSYRDQFTKTPEFKVTAVAVEKIDGS